METNPVLDLADFDLRRHAGVLLDGVGDALILKRNRESLQGRAKVSKGGQSATNMYAYKSERGVLHAELVPPVGRDRGACRLDQHIS